MGTPALLEFSGPDAVRYLNGQVTQDVRKVAGGKISLPACVTDAKGKLQFRIHLTESPEGKLWVSSDHAEAEALEARLTRYLIADDAEAADRSGSWSLLHFTGVTPDVPEGIIARESRRFGVAGTDWWIPNGVEAIGADAFPLLEGDELEAFRIARGIPVWGKELQEGMLPPEAALEETDISYHKGCYIGQEVISRIKSAGKVNKRLTRFAFDSGFSVSPGALENSAGEITSVSPFAVDGIRHALGYVKRNAAELSYQTSEGVVVPVRIAEPN